MHMAEMWNKCRIFVAKSYIIMYKKQGSAMAGLLQMAVLAMVTVFLTVSCMSDNADDDGPVRSNTCYISNVKFNTLRRQVTVKASDGVTDSTYYSTFTASRWMFSIDHRNLLVENRDSFPYDTDMSKCVMNLSYTGAIAYYRASDAWEDDPWLVYNGTDSIDLRKPLHIRVLATDKTERRYTLRANVHTMHGDSLRWETVAADPALSGACPMKAMGWEDKMAVMVNDGSAVLWLTHATGNLGDWTRQVTDLPLNADVASLACYGGEGQLYVNTTDGSLYASADGVSWNLLAQRDGLRLVGVSKDRIYVMAEGSLHSASIAGMTWIAERMDEDASLLPDGELAFLTYSDKDDVTRMLVAGNRSVAEDTTAVVWSRSWTEFENEGSEIWMHYNRTWDNTHQMPMLEYLNLVYYDNKLMAIGGRSLDGKVEALGRFLVSEDNGLTWWRLADVLPPVDLLNVTGHIASGVDRDEFLWLMAGGKVYRGRINRLGFARPDIE